MEAGRSAEEIINEYPGISRAMRNDYRNDRKNANTARIIPDGSKRRNGIAGAWNACGNVLPEYAKRPITRWSGAGCGGAMWRINVNGRYAVRIDTRNGVCWWRSGEVERA